MKKIALIIGLEYFGEYKLDGCYNDALNIISEIKNLYQFNNNEIIFISDKHNSNHGSRSQIVNSLNYVVKEDFDFIFFYYAGHGGYTKDYSGDETNLHSTFIMNNNSCADSFFYTIENNNKLGRLYDDTIKEILTNLSSTSTFLGLIDCCHSGTMVDCYYIYFPNHQYQNKYHRLYLDNHQNHLHLKFPKVLI